MKKVLVSLMIALVGTAGMTSFAQTQTNNAAQENKVCCDKNGKVACDRQKQRCAALFEGITLTADQQSRIDKINSDRQAKSKAQREMKSKEKKEMKKQKAEARKACKKEYLSKMKEVLTPEQYTVFLENIAINQPAFNKMGKGNFRHGGKGMNHGKGHRQARCQSSSQTCQQQPK